MKINIFSDLRKPGLVPGESLSLAENYVFCFREPLFYKEIIVYANYLISFLENCTYIDLLGIKWSIICNILDIYFQICNILYIMNVKYM